MSKLGRYNGPEYTGDIHIHIGVHASGKQRQINRMINGKRKETSDPAITTINPMYIVNVMWLHSVHPPSWYTILVSTHSWIVHTPG